MKKVEKRLTLLSALGVGIMSIVIIVQSPISELIEPTAEAHATAPAQEEKVKIKQDQLPSPVKRTLGNETYQGWKVVNVFLITAYDEEKSYEVELRKNQVAQLIRFDKDGRYK